MTNYSVLLSYVNRSNYNVLKVLSDNKDVLYTAETRQEPPLTPGENNTDVPPPFNAYSGIGSAEVSNYLPSAKSLSHSFSFRVLWCM